MRVIAGTARGVRLVAPQGMQTRPTADRVREALFSIIASRFELAGARVLDICAGTGSLGIEALSREAESCCFVESDKKALQSLKQNLETTRFSTRASVLPMEALKALCLLSGSRFEIVFFDPPYAADLYTAVLEALCRLSLIADGTLVVAEGTARTILPERVGTLVKVDRRVYGDTALEMYTLEVT